MSDDMSKKRDHPVLDKRWEKLYLQLVAFHRRHGHCVVPQGCKEAPNLARWVNSQRERLRNGTLPLDRKEKLDRLGFWWGTSNEDRWTAMFEKLVLFHGENGHYHVPCRYEADPAFSKWVTKQKAALRRDDLSLERKGKLESIGFPGPKPSKRKRAEVDNEEKEPSKKPTVTEQDARVPAF